MTAPQPKDTLAGADLAAWNDYTRYHRLKGHSARTITNHAGAIMSLFAYLAASSVYDCPLLEAGREEISGWLLWLEDTGRSKGTRRNRHAAMRSFYAWCVAEDIIDASPMLRIDAPIADYRVPEVMSDAELNALLATCKTAKSAPHRVKLAALRDEAMIRLFCEPGSPRASEMAALSVADMDMDTEQVTIRNGKNDRRRVIPVSSSTAQAMSRYLRERARDGAAAAPALWLGLKGPMTRFGVRQMLERRGKAAGIAGTVFPHRLRHTAFADFDAATGGHTNAEMELFGWSSPAMAHHYGKDGRRRAAIASARQLGRADRLAAS